MSSATHEHEDPTVRQFLEGRHRAHLERTSFTDYLIQVGHWERFFRVKVEPREPRLSDFSVARVEAAIAWRLDSGSSKATADKFRRALLAIWNRAASLDDFPGIFPPPPKRIRALKIPKRDPLAWWLHEFEAILSAAGRLPGTAGEVPLATLMSGILWTTYNSGLRITACMLCEQSWLDLDQRLLVVDPEVQKDDEGSCITLLPETCEALRPLIRPGKRRIFGDWPHDGRLLDQGLAPRALTKLLKQCIVGAGLAGSVDKVSRRDLWHKIRRTFATVVYAESRDIELVREMLGHSDVSVTWRYVDKTKLNRKTQADLLPRPRPHQLRLFGG